MRIDSVNSINDMDANAWNALVGGAYPFLRHEFLSALELSGAVSARTGWLPQHLALTDGRRLAAVMPLYLKGHPRGEYVFDHSWANAYHQAGLAYYPKYLTAVPFTPCQGPRWATAAATPQALLAFIQAQAIEQGISSWHCLFPAPEQAQALCAAGLSIREDVQFHWFNRGYRDFDDFLSTFTASKRKMVKRERRKVLEQGISFVSVRGSAADEAQWQAFFEFYQATYFKKAAKPYLNLAFFQTCAQLMGERMLLVLAVKDRRYVAAALSFIGADTLYGRYWGCADDYDALHFEACYYQGIDHCIAHRLQRFDSGAQGEHKIARGFEPVSTYSAHWLGNPAFARAVATFVEQEKAYKAQYKQAASGYLPFKAPSSD